jgi:hypothetical protein
VKPLCVEDTTGLTVPLDQRWSILAVQVIVPVPRLECDNSCIGMAINLGRTVLAMPLAVALSCPDFEDNDARSLVHMRVNLAIRFFSVHNVYSST